MQPETPMDATTFYIGIDPAAESFAAAIAAPTQSLKAVKDDFANSAEGFAVFEQWLATHHVVAQQAIVCVENTGVYSEHLCYWLHSRGWAVVLEHPQRLKGSFTLRSKTDALDAQQIAEYAWRYVDRLVRWQPSDAIVAQVEVLLATREQLSGQLTANRNALQAVQRRYVDTPAARAAHTQMIAYLKEQLKTIDAEIRRLIYEHPTIGAIFALLMSAPGVGFLLSANLLVLSRGFQQQLNYKHLASYCGICPHEYSSGTSVHRKAKSSGFGPQRMRKLLYLASMSLRTHQQSFRTYYERKHAEGKNGRLILNNIANKLLRILCAMINSKTPYLPKYRSINPVLANHS
jgi:transposase